MIYNFKNLTFLFLLPTGPILLSFIGLFISLYKPKFGKALTFASLIFLLFLSTPFFASILMSSLQKYNPINHSMLEDCQAIVVLGGGINQNASEYNSDTIGDASLVRLRYAIYLKKISGLPILASGGSPAGGQAESVIMKKTATTDFFSEVDWVEDISNNTSENAKQSASILKSKGIYKIILVTHAWHLYRSILLFESEGIRVLPAPTSFVFKNENGNYSFIPESGAMSASNIVIREWLGILAFKIIH